LPDASVAEFEVTPCAAPEQRQVSPCPWRIENLIEANRTLTRGKGSGLFLFAEAGWLSGAEPMLIRTLRNGRGEQVCLAPSPHISHPVGGLRAYTKPDPCDAG